MSKVDEDILSRGFMLGIKWSILYLIVFISSFILAPNELKPKIAVFSVILGLCVLVKKLRSKRK